MHIRAVIFDFDGVCIDTEMARFMSWQKIFAAFKLELPRDEWLKNIGKAAYVADPFDILERLAGNNLDREAIHEQHRINELEIADALPLLPGIADRLTEAQSLGIACGIASSSSHLWVDGHLRRRGIFEIFKVIICREDTAAHKPDPGPYLAALRRLDVNAKDAVAVEDSPAGIASARGQGCIASACPAV